LGERYGLGYLDLYDQGILAPIRKMHLDYVKPLRFREEFSIEGILYWSEAVRLNFEFILRNATGEVTTRGYTVQMLLDREENVLLLPPPFYAEFRRRWQQGELA
jgi:acyl-CoA thioester hydrolase